MGTKQCKRCGNAFLAASYFDEYCLYCQAEIIAEKEGITFDEAMDKLEGKIESEEVIEC